MIVDKLLPADRGPPPGVRNRYAQTYTILFYISSF